MNFDFIHHFLPNKYSLLITSLLDTHIALGNCGGNSTCSLNLAYFKPSNVSNLSNQTSFNYNKVNELKS